MNQPVMQDSNSEFEIPVPELFNFDVCLDYLSRSDKECLHQIEGKNLRKLLRVGERNVLINVQNNQDSALKVSVLEGDSLNEEEQRELTAYIRTWFDLDRDLTSFYTLAGEDPLLEKVIKHSHGLRIISIPDLFEAICWAVLGQQISLSFAYELKRRITLAYGDTMEWNGSTYYGFPSPEQLLTASPEDLYTLKLTRAKTNTVLEIARLMQSGELTRRRLLSMVDYNKMEQELRAIKGIGPWTANYVRMRCLGDQGAFPFGDVGLQNAVKLIWGLGEKPSEAYLKELFAKWKGWEGYVTFYLWRVLY